MDRENMISVIVPVYNVESFLPRCVDSILAQTYQNLEIILVNDGSQDASGAICQEYAAKDSRIRVIHKENGGLSSARNAGLDAAQGEYIALVDSDDWITEDACEYLLGKLRQYGVKLVCAGRYDVDGSTGEKTIGLCPEKEEVISGEEMVGRIFTWDKCDSSACDKLYHRSLLENQRYPVGVVCEDLTVTYKLALAAQKVLLCPKPVYHYYHRPGSITTASVSEKTFHYSRHTETIYPYIRDNYPGIAPQARFLRVRSLYHLILTLDQSGRDVCRVYGRELRKARRALRQHLAFVLRYPAFGRQERITNLLLALGLYRWLRPIFHRE